MPGDGTEITDDTVVDTTQASEAATNTDVSNTPAESSPADKAKDGEGDLLSAVKAALDPKAEKSSDSDKPGSETEEDPAKAASKDNAEKVETDPEDLTADELAQLRPKTRKRIENLVRDRNERDRKISEIEPKAQQFDQISRFVTEANLSKDEVNDGFAVMRDLKHAPEKAYERLKPIMQQLASMFGEGDLPTDLQQAVNTGQITEHHARELVTARSQSALATTRNAEQARQDAERQAETDRVTNVNAVASAVSEWERAKEKTDPSWKLKQPRVMELVELEIARKQRENPQFFPSKDEALKFSKDALAKVDKEMQAFIPKPRAMTPNVDAASSRNEAKPSNAVEAAKQALSRAS